MCDGLKQDRGQTRKQDEKQAVPCRPW